MARNPTGSASFRCRFKRPFAQFVLPHLAAPEKVLAVESLPPNAFVYPVAISIHGEQNIRQALLLSDQLITL